MKNFRSNVFLLMIGLAFILGACTGDENPCPDAQFTLSVDSTDFTYTFSAENVGDLVYGWYVNGQLVESESLDSIRDNIFSLKLDSGTYNICIKGTSDICGGEVEFCLPVTLDFEHHQVGGCPEPRFQAFRLEGLEYKFYADFAGRDSTQYDWVVDGDTIPGEALGTERTHKLYRTFLIGTHQVCIIAAIEGCGSLSFCEDVNTEVREGGNCPELYFEYDSDDEGHFVFEADFAGMDSTQYKWFVNGDQVDWENFDENGTDHKLMKYFEPGMYEVCIKNAIESCHETYCVNFTVGPICPDLFFHTDNLGGGSYVFTGDFIGRDSIEYKWFINDQFVEAENLDGQFTDNKLEKTFEPGVYHVCIRSKEGCESYCQEIIVEQPQTLDCKTISFTGQRDGTSLSYNFTADFEGRFTINYEWSVFVDGVYKGGKEYHTGTNDTHTLHWEMELGVNYEICIKQQDCADQKLCKEFVIN